MSTETGYNGWTNYETWCVSLWLSNDEYNYQATRDMAEEHAAGYDETDEGRHSATNDLAIELKEFVDTLAEETCPGSRTGASFVCDLLGAALGEVDYFEIATNLLSEIEVDA